MKRALDIGIAALGLVLCSPLMAAAALAIVLDDGWPILYRSERVGYCERRFAALKLRTMRNDADDYIDERGRPISEVRRVTRVGSVIRRLSIDELPQLLNVLRGEMSVVGPRPMIPAMAARLSDEQRRRFAVRPGLTGLAQISGRNTLPWTRRIDLDIVYAQGSSIWTDIRILVRTVGVVLRREGVVIDRNPDQVDDLPQAPTA